MGPDGVSAPSADQDLTGLGDKKPQDLIENAEFEYDGDTVKVSGELKNIKDAWAEFDVEGKNTGHFIPVLLPAECVSQKITVKGRRDGDRTVTIDPDRTLVTRLENLSGLTMDIEMNGEKLCTFDFTALVPTGEKAYRLDKADFGDYGKRDQMVEDFAITWNGTKATVTGKLKKHTATKLPTEGYYFPVGMSDWYDGVPKKGGINHIKEFAEQDMVLTITALDKPAKFEYNGLTVMEFDLSGMTLVP